jgi:hypothetical protein
VETIPLSSLLPSVESAEEDFEFPVPAAAASGSQTGEDPSLNRTQTVSLGLNVHRGGPPAGPSRGGTRGHSSSSRSSTSAAAYNKVAATPRNFLIHVYWSRDDLEPLDEFYTLRDKIKTSIWAFFVENGSDRDLSVKDWAFHREKRIGLIFCTSEARHS